MTAERKPSKRLHRVPRRILALKNKGAKHPTAEELEQLTKLCEKVAADFRERCSETADFKPGELTPEETEFVQREGLTRLNYIPKKALERGAAAFEDYKERLRHRSEVMSRPKNDPERVRLVNEEQAERLSRAISNRLDGFGYGMFLLLIIVITLGIFDISHNKALSAFTCLLMLAVLELSYRLHSRL